MRGLRPLTLRVIDERGARAKIAVAADIQLSQSELANMVGAARENVNKCLREWQRAGIIRMEKRVITVADRDKLEAVAERDLGAQNTRARGLQSRSYRDRVKRM